MGLDMYLVEDTGCDSFDDFNYEDELVYWRKCNQVHKYFCDVGEEIEAKVLYRIYREDLLRLLENIDIILKGEKSDKKLMAKILLPTSSGPFFGNTSYDEWYYDDLKLTKEALTDLLNKNNSNTFLYYANW